ncbi:hypothetical protein BSL78_09244 [Apostichopus japonicus]|uniref:Anaphase-promoting complex subunit 4 WD40 domain-containing protein n=1 Tax=Stichopus japonicus TaxID=307972 RepID=A0A2G8L0S0_STIJA|nr:hypothetical protein BSL78_09244 [Apostichopus japonicus]
MTKWDLQWSVSDPDTFVAFSTDKVEINFHRLTTKDEVSAGVVPWQQKQATKGELYLRSKADLQSVKCFALCPNPNSDNILALGLSTGKVVLSAFNSDPSLDKTELVGCEINPKHTKQCNSVTWNKTEHKLVCTQSLRHVRINHRMEKARRLKEQDLSLNLIPPVLETSPPQKVLSVKEVRPVGKLEWNPTRKGVLMSLPKESSVIKVYKLEHVASEMEYTERLIQPLSSQAVSNFAMHPSKENNMVVVSPTGTLKEFTVQDIISVRLVAISCIVIAGGVYARTRGRHFPRHEEESVAGLRYPETVGCECSVSTGTRYDVDEIVELDELYPYSDGHL